MNRVHLRLLIIRGTIEQRLDLLLDISDLIRRLHYNIIRSIVSIYNQFWLPICLPFICLLLLFFYGCCRRLAATWSRLLLHDRRLSSFLRGRRRRIWLCDQLLFYGLLFLLSTTHRSRSVRLRLPVNGQQIILQGRIMLKFGLIRFGELLTNFTQEVAIMPIFVLNILLRVWFACP